MKERKEAAGGRQRRRRRSLLLQCKLVRRFLTANSTI